MPSQTFLVGYNEAWFGPNWGSDYTTHFDLGYVQKTFERLGIADQIKDKSKVQATPGAIPQAVAKGEAELGVFLTNVLLAPGVELAGPFPGDLQNELVFVGGVAADSKDATAAKAFLDYLKTPEAIAVFKAKGVTPG